MDLFVKDWISLIYVWFLIIASLHAIVEFRMGDIKEKTTLGRVIFNSVLPEDFEFQKIEQQKT